MFDPVSFRGVRLSALLFFAGISATTAMPGTALAQDDTAIDEILITAQRREQTQLEVPVTVDVFSASDIRQTGALTLEEMQDFIPGFEVGRNPTQASMNIRGVSSPNISTGGDPSVATFYDDIYVPRAATQVTFGDMARVEVLKGPQGTLYGRNAAAGVVNMVPNAPGDQDEGFLRYRAGNYALNRFEAMGNIALSDSFFLRGNILSNKRDGYVENVIPGSRDPGTQDNLAFRVAARWLLDDATTVQLSLDHDELDNAPRPAIGISPWSECPNDPFCGRVRNDVIDGSEGRKMHAITGKILRDINEEWSSKFVAGYRKFDVVNRQDEDGTAEIDRYLDTDNVENSDIFYTELQFNFSNDRVNAVFGANFSDETTYQEIPVNFFADSSIRAVSAGLADGLGLPIDYLWDPNQMSAVMQALTGDPSITPDVITATGDFFYELLNQALLGMGVTGAPVIGPSWAGTEWSEYIYNRGSFQNWGVYGDIDYQLTDRFSVLFGLRYSDDHKEFSWNIPPNTIAQQAPQLGVQNIVFVPSPGYEDAITGDIEAENDWDKITGRAVANFEISDDAMTFLSYSTGYKAGGYDSLDERTSDNPLSPEETENIELGLKGNFFASRLYLQVALFRLNIDGRSRTVDSKPPGLPNALPRIINGDQEIEGVELVLNWTPIDSLRFGALTTYRDTTSTWEPFYNAVGDLVESEVSTGSTATDYTLLAEWYPEIANGSLTIRAEYIFNENTRADDPDLIDPTIPGLFNDRKDLNARIGWESDDGKWNAAVWGKNLTDNDRITGVTDISTAAFGTTHVNIAAPRTYGVEVGVAFGK